MTRQSFVQATPPEETIVRAEIYDTEFTGVLVGRGYDGELTLHVRDTEGNIRVVRPGRPEHAIRVKGVAPHPT